MALLFYMFGVFVNPRLRGLRGSLAKPPRGRGGMRTDAPETRRFSRCLVGSVVSNWDRERESLPKRVTRAGRKRRPSLEHIPPRRRFRDQWQKRCSFGGGGVGNSSNSPSHPEHPR